MTSEREPLPPGLYDTVVTRGLAPELERLAASWLVERDELDPSEAPELLARVLHDRIVHALRETHGGRGERVQRQLALANRLIELLAVEAPGSGAQPDDTFVSERSRLLALTPPGRANLGQPTSPPRPHVPLRSSDLFVNGHRDLRVGPEIAREIASADRVDLLCSFLKWSGLRLVSRELEDLLRARPGSVRVITTVYMGATERRAVDELSRLGAQVRISYDTAHTRLHAKAWLFHRDSDFSTAIIGSSNLSAAAMLDGLEWNVRLSKRDNPAILAKFGATFEQYWNEADFQPYDPARDHETFDAAVRRQLNDRSKLLLNFEITPKPHQVEILESLAAERARGHVRNLVVAATGTGKTIVAALDYKRLRKEAGLDSLLFVAHRREILEQSRLTFQVVMRDAAFGEVLAGGEVPMRGQHVFASVQSLDAERIAGLDPAAYDVVIVDEFHHAAAMTYDRLLAHLRPRILLGLTATPERADGRSILHWFDGRTASELRLWKALDHGLLSPFQYFGVSDGTTLSGITWTPSGYDRRELSRLYVESDSWWRRVLSEVHDKVHEPTRMRALGFCVSVAQAEVMAERFTGAGLPSRAVSADSPPTERQEALDGLARGDLRVLFSVDLFNEGVDLPAVDTVLFLRPTESATVFLQQLGRGLRRSDGKECLTVLDFIGDAHRKFRFDVRYQALLGGTRRQVEREVEQGFPRLPPGCSMHLERQARDIVLENIRRQLGTRTPDLAADLRAVGRDVGLMEYLALAQIDLEDVYASRRTWSALRRLAGLPTEPLSPYEATLGPALARMLHIDDHERIDAWRAFLRRDSASASPEDAFARMLFAVLGHRSRPLAEMPDAWSELWSAPAMRAELAQIMDVLDDRRRHLTWRWDPGIALHVHARYTRDEVLAAFDLRNKDGSIVELREGVKYVEHARTDLLFVTLHKSEADYSPSTMYDDYPISARRFHWQSQSTVHAGTTTGERYVHHAQRGGRVVLFVRERKKDGRGVTMPYWNLGPARYVSHEGGRPMSITWELERPMPPGLYQEIKVAAG